MTLNPPKEYKHLPWHWLRLNEQRIPAGYSIYTTPNGSKHGRWALADGNIFTDQTGWNRGYRYDKPCDPNAITPDPANEPMVDCVTVALHAEQAESTAIIRKVARLYARRVLAALAELGERETHKNQEPKT